MPVRPCVPITMRSAFTSRAYREDRVGRTRRGHHHGLSPQDSPILVGEQGRHRAPRIFLHFGLEIPDIGHDRHRCRRDAGAEVVCDVEHMQ